MIPLLIILFSFRVNDDDEAPWPQEKANKSSREIEYTREPDGLDDNSPDDNSKSKDKASFRLPSDSYSGAIIGGRFRLDALVEEHETPGEKTYAVSDLMAPERRLVARSYRLLGLPREYREARKRHMKRLLRRENGCNVRQDGKIYVVYTCDHLASPSTAAQLSAHDLIRRGVKPPGSFKALQDDTEFPPLSIDASKSQQNTFCEVSKVQGLFRMQKQQAPLTRPEPADSIVPGQVSVPKQKRHRWRKAKRHDPPETCTAAEPKELAVLAGTDEGSEPVAIPHPNMVNPSFGCLVEMDNHLAICAGTIIAMAAEVEGCNLPAVRTSVWRLAVPTTVTKVIDDIAMLDLKFAEQNARTQTVLRLMRQHFSVQRRRAEIDNLESDAASISARIKDKSRLERRLRARLMKAREGKSKERIKVGHAKICKELDDFNLHLEEGVRRKAEILAGGTALSE